MPEEDNEEDEEEGSEDEITLPENISPKVSDAILEFLQERGKEGARIADIKDYIQRTYHLEMHEKTPGMTLFRLQKLGRVTRDKRVWFIVPPSKDSETMNPGGDTPGSD